MVSLRRQRAITGVKQGSIRAIRSRLIIIIKKLIGILVFSV